ncbi:MAG: hypothetical protein HYV96_17465 [Opitutae bacterium]|nr:hypothetical protein [Opitutae bacterium]
MRVLALLLAVVAPLPAVAADAASPAPSAAAAPALAAKADASEPFDLGEGLGYLRAHRVADALPVLERAMTSGQALVLDLRFATAAKSDAPALALALAQRAPAAPLFVLVSPQTPAMLTSALAGLRPPALTLGVDGSLPSPAVVVAQPADVDRRAYDALESGMPLGALITGKIEKERFDEAELVKEFEHGNPNAAPPADPDPSQPAAEKAPVLTDRVLQRAVHLHRALLALKRN